MVEGFSRQTPATWTREFARLDIIQVASLVVALATVVFTTYMLSRQVRQMEHERNALAILDAIDRLTSSEVVNVFLQLRDVDKRYPTDKDIREKFFGSADEHALNQVGQFVETIACLARRDVLDVTLIVDAVGFMLRERWATIKPFVIHWRTTTTTSSSSRTSSGWPTTAPGGETSRGHERPTTIRSNSRRLVDRRYHAPIFDDLAFWSRVRSAARVLRSRAVRECG
jgi:hypothetical protein